MTLFKCNKYVTLVHNGIFLLLSVMDTSLFYGHRSRIIAAAETGKVLIAETSLPIEEDIKIDFGEYIIHEFIL